MMGWAMFAAVGVAAGAILWLTGFPRRIWTLGATALMLGAAGYAWQGRPTLAGHPIVAEEAKPRAIDENLVALRDAMFGRFNFDSQYFLAADAMTRINSPRNAVAVMVGGVRKAPQDAGLWTWLGLTLAEHDANMVSGPSRYAFEKALALAPQHPGPPFFYGLALIREGRFADARPYWAQAVELTPEKASYRDELRVRLFLLDRLLASQAAQQGEGVSEGQEQPQR